MPPWLRPADAGVEISIHIQPGATRSELAGEHGEALKVRISARPVEGAANAALTEFMARCLGVARREVRIVRGEKSRQKVLWAPVAPELAQRRLSCDPGPGTPPSRAPESRHARGGPAHDMEEGKN